MTVALWLSFVVACVVSVVIWLSNLEVAASSIEAETGLWLVRSAWGVFLALALLKLMMMR